MNGTATLIIVLALLGLGYLGSCQIWPLVPCPRCSGGKKHAPGSNSKAFRHCRICKGKGKRYRFWSFRWYGRDRWDV